MTVEETESICLGCRKTTREHHYFNWYNYINSTWNPNIKWLPIDSSLKHDDSEDCSRVNEFRVIHHKLVVVFEYELCNETTLERKYQNRDNTKDKGNI